MKAKISALDPTGVVTEQEEFNIPVIKEIVYGSTILINGIPIQEEPMKVERYLLEIGDFKYLVKRNGELKLIDYDRE